MQNQPSVQVLALLDFAVLPVLSTDIADGSVWFVTQGGGPCSGLLGHPPRKRQTRQLGLCAQRRISNPMAAYNPANGYIQWESVDIGPSCV